MKEPITIYINPLTVNNIKILLICNALKLTAEFIHIAINKGEQRTADFLKLNPEGKVPVLLQGSNKLTESHAIMQYLANTNQSTLWPDCAKEQAEVLRVLFWQSNHFNSAVGLFPQRKVVKPHWGFSGTDIDEEHFTEFNKALAGLEQILSKSSYVTGNQLTIADISLSAFFIFAQQSRMPLAPYPRVQEWLRGITQENWFHSTKSYLNSILLR